MGKDVDTKRQKKQQQRHTPLEQQIKESQEIKKRDRTKKSKRNEDDEEKKYVDKDLSKKILGLAQSHAQDVDDDDHEPKKAQAKKKNLRFVKNEKESEDELSGDEGDYHIDELDEITEEDEKALQMFMSDKAPQRSSLADMIMSKIKEKESNIDNLDTQITSSLDPKVVEVYKSVGAMLTRYTSGKIPKAFKIIPSLSNWEEILYLTEPDKWSPGATRQATKIFASNLNANMAQKFYTSVLLPNVVDNIREYKKLNYQLYMAVKKATYKPAAFYRGLVLPLCESGDCSLRCAVIVGSVISKVSIPVLHSSAAILKIAEMEYSGANSYFLAIMLNKKYALPYRVVDALVAHFMQFLEDQRKLPVLWFQALLIFIQRYKTDLTPDQKEQIKALMRVHVHSFFTEEVRRELANSRCRGESEPNQEMDMS